MKFLIPAGLGLAGLFLLLPRKPGASPTPPTMPPNSYWKNRLWTAKGKYRDYYERAAQRHRELTPALLQAIALVESNENDPRYTGQDGRAIGAAGEMGMMQIIPSTLQYIRENTPGAMLLDPFAPAGAIELAAALFVLNLGRLEGNISRAVIAYQAGSANSRTSNPGDWYLIRVQTALNQITEVSP